MHMFQGTLESLLAGIPNVCVFLDDILVTGKTEQQHVENLRTVLKCLENASLRQNKQECEFFQPSVTYLGHRIDRNGLHPTVDKVEAVRNAPRSTNVKELKKKARNRELLWSIQVEPFFETGTVVWVVKEGVK